ncbi:hypothetical protein GLOIN_2v1867267 [Rhizophagus clarus]|uniref:Uncharacterized protein n=1 Tax=Rhizophagus clarus TaxID=94130 RepID=A0A8H3QT92_9GLOM|nr:hypothetical protein GLOIN_2v1867267 [Rhizophagus clarus]
MRKLFLVADKFTQENITYNHDEINDINTKQLINLLQKFTENRELDLDELIKIDQEDKISDKENVDPSVLVLRNPKKQCDKKQFLGTKRFKSFTKILKPKF